METKILTTRVDARTIEVFVARRWQPRQRWGKTLIGTVQKQGSRPSCTKYYAFTSSGVRLGSYRTQTEAVKFLAKGVAA